MKVIDEAVTVVSEWQEVSVRTHTKTAACDWLKSKIPGISNMDGGGGNMGLMSKGIHYSLTFS